MIKVNLLPAKRRKKPKPVPTFVIAGVMLLLGSFIVSGYVVYFLNSRIEKLEAQKADNAKKIIELNKKIKEVKDYEARNKVFMERKKVIEELTRNQSLPVKILDEMSKRLTDGIWLTSMDISRGKVSLAGSGFSNSDIVSYVQSLKGSALFTDVALLGTKCSDKGGVQVCSFNIKFAVKT